MKKVFYLSLLLLGFLSVWVAQPETTHASSNYMGCYIDTPAIDSFWNGGCARSGALPTVAVFKVFGPADSIIWSGCSSNQDICSVPISPGQSVTVSAQVVVDGQVVRTVSATAYYGILNW